MAYAASAFAANVIVRSCAAAAFPLFTNQMYGNVRLRFHSHISLHTLTALRILHSIRPLLHAMSDCFLPNIARVELGL